MLTDDIKKTLGLETFPEKTDAKWEMFDDGGVEVEVGEFLFGLIRAHKPTRVLETGTYSGISASYMGMALKENGFGTLDTVEYEQIHINRSKERFIKLGLQDIITIHQVSSLEFKPQGEYDIILHDTEPNIRYQELVKFYPHLKAGGFAFIHDLPRTFCYGHTNPDHPDEVAWPFGEVPKEMKQLNLSMFHLGSARGMVGFYKPHEEDWK